VTALDTKARILAAAVNLFSERGFSAVSMREMARAVGISVAALYNHFDSKESLYQAAVSAAFAHKGAGLLAALEAEDAPLVRLGRFVRMVAESVRQDPSFAALMQRELLDGDDSRLGFLGRMVFNPVERPFMALLQELRPGCDAFLLTELIFGMIKQHDEMRFLHPFLATSGSSERTPQQIADLVMQLLTPYFSGASR
jgi:TetR/AcrR family transcriptional regulator